MKKIQRLWMFAALLCCTSFMSAQEARNSAYYITLGNVTYTHHDEKMDAGQAIGKALVGLVTGHISIEAVKYEQDVKNAIIKGLSESYRFRYKDGLKAIDDDAMAGDLMADALITNIRATTNSWTYKDRDDKTRVNTYYEGRVEVLLTIKDLKTGEVIANPTVSGLGTGQARFTTPEQAIHDALGRLANHITIWLKQFKPLEANLIEGTAAKKDKQKEVYIDLGSKEGACQGLHMGVFRVRNVADKQARTQIGKLKILAVEGEDVSRCKVLSGGKDIKTAIDDGEQLLVVTVDR